jgi:DNA polymerase III sliding clamp (beta) subunit (PCNA family)
MSEQIQRTVFGESIKEQIHLETTGRILRPFKRMLDPWSRKPTEYRLEFTTDGLEVGYINPSNVVAVNATIPTDTFDVYDTEGAAIGVNSDVLGSILQHARYGKSTDDELTISADTENIQSVVHREIADTHAAITEQQALIDPDMIRDADPISEDVRNNTTAELELSGRDYIEIAEMLDDSHPTTMKATDGTVSFTQEGDVMGRDITLETGSGEAEAMFSTDYLQGVATAFNVGYIDTATIQWGNEWPVFVEFEREDVYSGEIMIAPRVIKDE